jgi:hypothetical protein
MRNDLDQDGSGTPASGGAKKPYRTPRLVTHGDLRKLALGGGGKKNDGKKKPRSKGRGGSSDDDD